MRSINLNIFKRVTSSGQFIYQIDGIRFFAIFPVIIFHMNGYFNNKFSFDLFHDSFIFNRLVLHGSNGVELFFTLSGFILLLPFVRETKKRIDSDSLKKYYLRRITRLEPPYIITMTLFLIVLLFRGQDTEIILRSYLSSLFYSHNIIFGKPSIINTVVWTLEIELQFYILAPIIALLFLVEDKLVRRIILISLILLGSTLAYNSLIQTQTLFSFFHFFMAGILLADLYSHEGFQIFTLRKFNFIAWLTCLFVLFWLGYKDSLIISIVYPFILMTFFILSFQHGFVKRIINFKFIYLIGGMCYSIYLLHYPLISFITPIIMAFFGSESHLCLTLVFIMVIIIILGIASLFFILVEKPAMYKDWYRVSPRIIIQRILSE